MKSRHPEKNSGQAELTQISRIPIKYLYNIADTTELTQISRIPIKYFM